MYIYIYDYIINLYKFIILYLGTAATVKMFAGTSAIRTHRTELIIIILYSCAYSYAVVHIYR